MADETIFAKKIDEFWVKIVGNLAKKFIFEKYLLDTVRFFVFRMEMRHFTSQLHLDVREWPRS